MDCRSIEIFYNEYKNSISTIRNLEKKLLGEAYSYERWLYFLREKSKTIRALYVQNEELFDMTVGELKRNPELLDMELAEMFLTHIDFFMAAGYRDYGVVVPVLDVLIPFYEKNGPKARLFDCYYFQGLAIMEQYRYEEAAVWCGVALNLYPVFDECVENNRIFHIMCAGYYRLLSCRMQELPDQACLLEYYQSAFDLWTKNVPDGFLTPKKTDAIASIIRTVAGGAINDALTRGEEILPELESVVRVEYRIRQQQGKRVGCEIYTAYYKLQWKSGEIDQEAYAQRLLDKYREETGARSGGYRYGAWDFMSLFDDELPDEEFDEENLFYMNESFACVQYVIPELLKNTDDPRLHKELMQAAYGYYAQMDYIDGDSIIDRLIVQNLKAILHYCTDVGMVNLFILNVFVHRQICTAIHSLMVSSLAELITGHLLDFYPEEMAELLGVSSSDEALRRREEWMGYAKQAGLCHDVGKLICSDVINLQSRRIQDAEFAMIKRHPGCGGDILHECPVLREYEDVAKGHHKTYDGKMGYPREFDNTASPHRLIIDIITICDSVDAATDRLGRNYTNAKTFRQVLGELEEGSGSRYNGRLVELIAKDEALIADIEKLTGDDRAMTQFQVYKSFVRPDVNFVPEDEKYIRPCREEDIARICAFSGMTEKEQADVYGQSGSFRYLLLDGHDTVFGAVFAEKKDGENMDILQICVDKRHRKQGFGSMLVEHLTNMAYSRGVRHIYMREVTEGHYDIFGWRNGFVRSEREGYLVREL